MYISLNNRRRIGFAFKFDVDIHCRSLKIVIERQNSMVGDEVSLDYLSKKIKKLLGMAGVNLSFFIRINKEQKSQI